MTESVYLFSASRVELCTENIFILSMRYNMRTLIFSAIAALSFAGCYTQTTSSGGDYWGYTGTVKHQTTKQTQVQRDSSTNPPTTTITTTTTATTEYQGDDENYGLWAHSEPSLIEHYSTNTYDGSGATVVNNYYIDNDYYSRPSYRHWWRPHYSYPSYWGYDPYYNPYWFGFSTSFGCGSPYVGYNYGGYDPYCGWNSPYYGGWYPYHSSWSSWDDPYGYYQRPYYGGYRSNYSDNNISRGGKRGRIPGADRLPGGVTTGGDRLPITTSLSGGGSTNQNNFRPANTSSVNTSGFSRQPDAVKLSTTGSTSSGATATPRARSTRDYTAPSNTARPIQTLKSDRVIPAQNNNTSGSSGNRQPVTNDRSGSQQQQKSNDRPARVSHEPAQSSSGSSSNSGGRSSSSSSSSGNQNSDRREAK